VSKYSLAGRNRVKRKYIEIMIEIDEVISAGLGNQLSRAWCSGCCDEALMATPQQAAALGGVSVRAVNRSVEAGQVHFLETQDGQLLVCVNSLAGNSKVESLEIPMRDITGRLKT
jgi:hypothetical protein